MAKFVYDKAFKNFAQSLQALIAGYGETDEDFTKKQKRQVENLVKAEKIFKKILQNDSRGEQVYKKFIDFVWKSGKDKKRNILIARIFFRERHSSFSKGISPAIRKRKHKGLYKFNINYPFIVFVLKAINWGPNSKIVKAAQEVFLARKEIIELNMPLAISRARIFRQRTPESHLSYMDLVQISFEGLINAVDKFVLPYTPVFRSVIIGRIVGDLIDCYSEPMLHFYPSDKRKIYRANKAQRGGAELDFESLAKRVNSGTKLENPTNSNEIQHLMIATSHYSLDSPAPESVCGTESGDTLADIYSADSNVQPDVMVEKNDLNVSLNKAINGLDLLEIKFLRLKGINYDNGIQ